MLRSTDPNDIRGTGFLVRQTRTELVVEKVACNTGLEDEASSRREPKGAAR